MMNILYSRLFFSTLFATTYLRSVLLQCCICIPILLTLSKKFSYLILNKLIVEGFQILGASIN